MTPDQIDRATALLTEDLHRLGFLNLTFRETTQNDVPGLDLWINDMFYARMETEHDCEREHAILQPLAMSNPDPACRCQVCRIPIEYFYPSDRCPEHFMELPDEERAALSARTAMSIGMHWILASYPARQAQ